MQITTTTNNGKASLPARAGNPYYHLVYATVTANGATTTRLMSPIAWNTGAIAESIYNLLGYDTWAEVTTQLTALGISPIPKDPNASK